MSTVALLTVNFVHFADFQMPISPITPAARISALNIVGDLLRKLGVSFVLVIC